MAPRTEWTDARLNDLVERLDRNMERLHEGLLYLRSEMLEMRGEMSELRRHGVLATVALVAAIVSTGVLT